MSSPPVKRSALLKAIVLGDSGVGKTSLINRYAQNKFNQQFKPTIGADFVTRELQIDGKLVSLQLWDTAGQERFQSLGTSFFRGSHCCVLVYDVNVRKSFIDLQTWHDEFIKHMDVPDPSMFPFVIIGNKIDLEGGAARAVDNKKAKDWCQSITGSSEKDVPYFETSAKENRNVDEAFFNVAKAAISHGCLQEISYESMTGSLSEFVEPQSGGCPC